MAPIIHYVEVLRISIQKLNVSLIIGILVLVSTFIACCKHDEMQAPTNTIVYKTDGRTVKLGNPSPIVVDLSGDGQVDFTIFVELTANSKGDRLYAGVNPIGANQIKSGPPIDQNFLSMGLLIAESIGDTIDINVATDQIWTSEHSALAIRNTFTNGDISYEGNWADSTQIVGIQNNIKGSIHYGWLRINFDKITEIVTLIEYAYDSIPSQPIIAGAVSN